MIESLNVDTEDGELLQAELFVPDDHAGSVVQTAVLIAHPNPLMGGDMYTPVPSALFRSLDRLGAAGLRFNFRGVGHSTGTHDHGNAERFDIAASLGALADRAPEARIIVSGWSFGADLALTVSHPRVAGRLLVAAPFKVVEPSAMVASQQPEPKWFITGSVDDLAPPDAVSTKTQTWVNTSIRVVPEADHFFAGRLDEITSALADLISEL